MQHAEIMIVARRADPFHFARVEIGPLGADQLAENLIAVKRADGEPVRFCHPIDMVCRNQAAGAGHVIDDDRWIAGDIFSHVARHRARKGVETAAR